MQLFLQWFWKNNFIIGLLAIETAICAAFPRKRKRPTGEILSGLLLILLSCMMMQTWQWNGQTIAEQNIVNNVLCGTLLELLSSGRMFLSYELSFWTCLFLTIISATTQQTCFGIYKMVEMIFMGTIEVAVPGLLSVLLNLLFLLPGCLLTYNMFRGKSRIVLQVTDHDKKVIGWAWVVLTLHEYYNKYLFVHDPYINTGTTMILSRLYFTMFSVVAVYMLYNLLARRTLEIEQLAMEAINRQRSMQYAFSQELIDSLNIKGHDLKKQVNYLRRTNTGREELLSELENVGNSLDTLFHTSCSALNTVLSEKSMVCYRSGIPFSCIADGEGMEFMRELDIYTLFANLMDNAIEASQRLPEGKASISLIIKRQDGLLSIHSENLFDGELHENDGRLMTVKEDKLYHGFGVRSMQQIAEQYDGVLSFKTEGNVFKLNILIPIADPESTGA